MQVGREGRERESPQANSPVSVEPAAGPQDHDLHQNQPTELARCPATYFSRSSICLCIQSMIVIMPWLCHWMLKFLFLQIEFVSLASN